MDAEVIVLDSDDEDNRNNASMNGGSALASIAIVNSKPLDLDALGIGSLRPDDGVLNNNQNTRHYYGMRPMEERQHGLMSANRIKSNTNVAYMQTVTPISSSNPRPPVRIGYEKTRPRQAQALEDTGINAVSLLGGGSTRPIQTRPSRAQNNSPSSRSSVRHVPDSRVQNYNFEVNGEKSSDSDRQLCPTLKFREMHQTSTKITSRRAVRDAQRLLDICASDHVFTLVTNQYCSSMKSLNLICYPLNSENMARLSFLL